ncbi:MAG: TIGR02996 domain-containing protein, partial [Planctomycetes bacterium]|nr:TIGR02996 domain-containing protein [Planctomycetota bacterium]
MSDRAAFLRAIAADPADDTVRLAFADWLDEHDEPDRAEFIRLQINRARSGQEPKNPDLPPREQALLSEHKTKWFGPLANFERHEGFEYAARRGFVESATIYGRLVAEHGAVLRDHCPALTELDVIGVRGFGERLANEFPSGIRTLRLEDWPFPDDTKAIMGSPNLAHLESLSFWIGSTNDEAVCRAIGAARAFPALKRVELVQLNGGIDADEEAPALDARADQLAALVNTTRRSTVATVTRPCSELLPLAPYVGWNLHGGSVLGGRQALIHARIENNAGECLVYYFDAAGNLVGGEAIGVTGALRQRVDYRGYNEEELYAFLGERIGFKPETIRVHEFSADQVFPGNWTRIYKYDGNALEFIESGGEASPFR